MISCVLHILHVLFVILRKDTVYLNGKEARSLRSLFSTSISAAEQDIPIELGSPESAEHHVLLLVNIEGLMPCHYLLFHKQLI